MIILEVLSSIFLFAAGVVLLFPLFKEEPEVPLAELEALGESMEALKGALSSDARIRIDEYAGKSKKFIRFQRRCATVGLVLLILGTILHWVAL